MEMFNFIIINTPDGNQVIDRTLKTPEDSLTAVQMLDYIEIDSNLSYMDRMERKARTEAEHRRKIARNPIYKLACFCGLV